MYYSAQYHPKHLVQCETYAAGIHPIEDTLGHDKAGCLGNRPGSDHMTNFLGISTIDSAASEKSDVHINISVIGRFFCRFLRVFIPS